MPVKHWEVFARLLIDCYFPSTIQLNWSLDLLGCHKDCVWKQPDRIITDSVFLKIQYGAYPLPELLRHRFKQYRTLHLEREFWPRKLFLLFEHTKAPTIQLSFIISRLSPASELILMHRSLVDYIFSMMMLWFQKRPLNVLRAICLNKGDIRDLKLKWRG